MQGYPSPNAMPADGGGQYYSQSASQQQQQPELSNPEALQGIAQLSRGIAPMMNAGPAGEGQDPRVNLQHQYHHEQAQQHAVHLQAGPGQMDPMAGQQYAASPGDASSNRKRSKTSRACDVCRQKKIKCDAIDETGDPPCSSCKRVNARCQFSRVPQKRGPSRGYIKELEQRVGKLEHVTKQQGSDVPAHQYHHQDSPSQRRDSQEFSPAQESDNMQRKRTFSSVSGGDFETAYQPQRPATGWASQELPRHLPHPSSAFATPQSAPPSTTHVFLRDPNYGPNGLAPTPQWRPAPEPLRRQSSSYESVPQTDHSHPDRVADWDESIVDGYYNFIHPTYPLLSLTKSGLRNKLANCPVALREAFYEALYAAVRSFPTPNTPAPEQQSSGKAAQLILASQNENAAGRTMATNLIYLQVMLLGAIEADNRDTARAQVGFLQSFWFGSAVSFAYSMKLHAQKIPIQQSENDSDSDERLARRIWWSLVIMDRWRAASESCPLLIPDTSVVIFQEDQALLGENVYQLARMSIILGHFTLIPTDLPELSVPSVPVLHTLLRGELERFRESFPTSFFPPLNAPLLHICYWYARVLMAMRLPWSEPQDLCSAALEIVTQLKNNTSLVSPLTHLATAFAAVALIECTGYEQTRKEAESGLSAILDGRIAPSGWDASIREMIVKNKNPGQSSGAGGAVGANSGTTQHAAIASQGLQHLAELATATTEEGKAESSIGEGRKELDSQKYLSTRAPDLRELVRVGYWGKLGGDAVR